MTANLVHGARAVVPDLQRAIEQKENQISILLGRNPGPSAGVSPFWNRS